MKSDNRILDTIIQGDCLDVLRSLADNSVDACVVDPPYGLGEVKDIAGLLQAWIRDEDDSRYLGKSGFMGKEWDAGVPGPRYWREVLRVMKPGAHILCFASTRTVDLMMIALRLAGFQCRDTLMWVYGCLSEDTEILIDGQWEPYHKAIAGKHALCYNVTTKTFGWEPIKEVVTYDYNDTAFRIHSDNTDQLVSRNHRCIVERSGSQVFQYAETLQSEESVPILEDLPALLETLPLPYERASGTKQDVFSGMRQLSACGKATCREVTNGATQGLDIGELLSMWQRDMEAKSVAQEGERANLLTSLQGSATRARVGKTRSRRTLCLDRREQQILSRENEWSQQSSLEGRSNLLQNARQLYGREVCTVSSGISGNGTQGRLRNGASSIRGSDSGTATLERRSSTSQRPQSWEQRSEQSATVCQQFRPQTIRASRYTSTDLATVTPVHYQGVVWCVRVPSGAFVARRNGKVFITGNSGFPKSTDISKKIDKMQGAEREVIGEKRTPDGLLHSARQGERSGKSGGIKGKSVTPSPMSSYITAPSTPEACQHAGTGTALKPAHEPIILARKPLSEKSIAANVLKWGTGGLNIDASRVGNDTSRGDRYNGKPSKGGSGNTFPIKHPEPWDVPQGRFPSNLLLSHSLFCVPLGTRKVKGAAPPGRPSRGQAAVEGASWQLPRNSEMTRYADEDGLEEVQAWECDPSCPVYQLDLQSGIRKSGGMVGKRYEWKQDHGASAPFAREGDLSGRCFADQGGASRYFQTFYYCPKASRRERNFGCEGLPVTEQRSYNHNYSDWTADTRHPNGGYEKNASPPLQNNHPTVKSLSLMRYLVRLCTPPGGTVLDCFAGSGSTCVAALQEGFHFIGIEQETEYVEIARARIAYAMKGEN